MHEWTKAQRAYMIGVPIAGVVFMVFLLARDAVALDNPLDLGRFGTSDLAIFLALCAGLLSLSPVRLSSGISLSTNAAATFAAVLSLPPGLTAVVAVCGIATYPLFAREFRWHRYIFMFTAYGLTYGISGLLFATANRTVLVPRLIGTVLAGLLAFAAASVLNVALTVVAASISFRLPIRWAAAKTVQESAVAYAALPAFGLAVAYLVHDRQPTGILVAAALVLGIALYGRLLVGAHKGRRLVGSSGSWQRAGERSTAMDMVMLAIAVKGLEAVEADRCMVFILERGSGLLKAEAPALPNGLSVIALDPALGLLSAVLKAATPVSVSIDEGRLFEGWLSSRGLRSALAAALRSSDSRGLGIVVVGREDGRKFGEEEIASIIQLSDEVSVAISSGDLISRAQDLSALEHRMQMAREVHDRLAGDLSTASALFKFYETEHDDASPANGQRTLDHIRDLVDAALSDSRDILSTLRPDPPEADALEEAIRRFASELSAAFRIQVTVDIRGDSTALPAQERQAIYWVAREALTNVRKHAGASKVAVGLDLGAHPFELTVEDDGIGIVQEIAIAKTGSYGITGMRERAAAISASLRVERLDGGSRITLIGPFGAEAKD